MKSILHILSLTLTTILDTFSAPQTAPPDTDSEPLCQYSFREPQNTTIRSIFHLTKCEVRAYPSLGGIVLKSLTATELTWLGLSRSQPSLRSPDPQTEDDFAFQLLRLGARWWKSVSFHEHRYSQVSGGGPYTVYPPVVEVGYPSTGGVWVFALRSGERLPENWAKVVMAFTMDERCAALEEMGATFYAVVGDCEDMAKSLEDGVEVGRRWEERMRGIDG